MLLERMQTRTIVSVLVLLAGLVGCGGKTTLFVEGAGGQASGGEGGTATSSSGGSSSGSGTNDEGGEGAEEEPAPPQGGTSDKNCLLLTGRVVDADGSAIGGATVYLHVGEGSGSGPIAASSDKIRASDDGTFALYDNGWTSGIEVWLVADAPGGRRAFVDLPEPLGCGERDVGDVVPR